MLFYFLFYIFCSFFSFFFSFLIHTSVHSKNSFSFRPFNFFSKGRHLWEKKERYSIHVTFDVLKQTFKKNSPIIFCLFFLFIHYLNTVDLADYDLWFALSWCHIYHSHSPSMAYISLIHIHSPS